MILARAICLIASVSCLAHQPADNAQQGGSCGRRARWSVDEFRDSEREIGRPGIPSLRSTHYQIDRQIEAR